MTVLGEARLDSDGALHGWCWDHLRPKERLTVEVLIDGEVVASAVASRFREDIRDRKFGDGYHGFNIVLTKQLGLSSSQATLSVRERNSTKIVWRKVLGEFRLPDDFGDRIADCQNELARMAWAPLLTTGPKTNKRARVGGALAALAVQLRGQNRKPAPQPPISVKLANQTKPKLSLILNAGMDHALVMPYLRRSAQALAMAYAQVVVTDGGTAPQTLDDQALANTLSYIFCPATSHAGQRNLASRAALGDILIFLDLRNAGRLAPDWQVLRHHAAHRLILSAGIAELLKRLAPAVLSGVVEISAPAGQEIKLALPSRFIQDYGGFDETIEDGSGLDLLDWVLRAAKAGAPLAVWQTPHIPCVPPLRISTGGATGQIFAERWGVALG
ncbi:MAG TPA: hypothetical protein PLY97_02170 [Acidocella sp.]|nr:MAG: hypothetical protein B7Z80_00615 [Rhodospirillales bacterium 20-64-7]HQT46002.1 hypothetical protein [Acidocella sp.]